jgi:hypothetical protein
MFTPMEARIVDHYRNHVGSILAEEAESAAR